MILGISISPSPFVTNIGTHGIHARVKRKVINDPKQISEIFNKYYIYIVEETTGNPPAEIPDGDLIDGIWSYNDHHASISTIRNSQQWKTF